MPICSKCNKPIPEPEKGSCTTGYGEDDKGRPVCYPCCAADDRKHMIEHGRITLYLTSAADGKLTKHSVSNWPGSLKFPVYHLRTGDHNMTGKRYDAWFEGPDGHIWHGVQFGDMTQIIHCKRTKRKIK